jgi:hypothetical protein
MKKYLVVLFLIPSLTWAECKQPVSLLKEGEKAECLGYLFTPEKEAEVRTKIANYNNLDLITKKQDELIDILNKRVYNQIEQNQLLSNQLELREKESFTQKAIFFIVGAVVTGLIAYGTVQAVK